MCIGMSLFRAPSTKNFPLNPTIFKKTRAIRSIHPPTIPHIINILPHLSRIQSKPGQSFYKAAAEL